jgi:tetratricopeptide (TPR) repeat protein
MNRKSLPHIIAAGALAVYIVLGLASGTMDGRGDSSSWGGRSQPPLRNAQAYYERAATNNKNGRYEQAIEDLTDVIRLAPHNYQGYNGRAWTYAYYLKRNFGQAIDDANHALGLVPNELRYYVLDTRGWAYLGNGDFDRALEDFNAVLQFAPNLQTSLEGRALALQGLR